MPGVADWRDPGGYQPDHALDWPSIAMGYLARNEHYRADHADALSRVQAGSREIGAATSALIDRWGISFPVDPERPPDLRDVVVPPERSPTTLTLVAAPHRRQSIIPCPNDLDLAIRFERAEYIVLRDADGDHRLWTTSPRTGDWALLLPLDVVAGLRLAAANRLFRRLAGLARGPSPMLPTRLKLKRHLRLFRLLDGRWSGANAKSLAAVLIDPRVQDFCAAEWADCRERKQIGRWAREASRLRDGGYIELLREGG